MSTFFSQCVHRSNMKIIRLRHTFSPGLDLGITGDKIHVIVKPCCCLCFANQSEFFQAIQQMCFFVEGQVLIGRVCRLTKEREAISSFNGTFVYTLDYGDLRPHLPEAAIFITLTLKIIRCNVALLGLPPGIDELVEGYHGQFKLHATGSC
jgi:hypothetical protein